jgi:hypothetical protein
MLISLRRHFVLSHNLNGDERKKKKIIAVFIMTRDQLFQVLFSCFLIVFVLFSISSSEERLRDRDVRAAEYLYFSPVVEALTHTPVSCSEIVVSLFIWVYSINYLYGSSLKFFGLLVSTLLFYVSTFRFDIMIILQNVAAIISIFEDEKGYLLLSIVLHEYMNTSRESIKCIFVSKSSFDSIDTPVSSYSTTESDESENNSPILSCGVVNHYHQRMKDISVTAVELLLFKNDNSSLSCRTSNSPPLHRPGIKQFNYTVTNNE